MKFYKIDTKEIINTVTDIPDEMLKKKGLKRVIEKEIKVLDTEELPNTEIVDKGEYVITTFKHYHEQTLDEIKVSRKKEVKDWYWNVLTQNGFECKNGIKLDCREGDKINWLTLKLQCLWTDTKGITIKDWDNKVHIIETKEEVMGMLAEIESYYANMLYIKWGYEKEIEDCKDIDSVNKQQLFLTDEEYKIKLSVPLEVEVE